MLIQEGELLTGTLEKKSLGKSAGGLVHTIWMEMGSQATKHFLDNVQYAVNYWLLHNGFSVGVGDTVADNKTIDTITTFIDDAKREVRGVVGSVRLPLARPAIAVAGCRIL